MKTYTLRYTVHNGLRYYPDGDQLWWNAIYADRAFPVLSGTMVVELPAQAKAMNWAAYINEQDARTDAIATVDNEQNIVQFILDRRLFAGEGFEVRVQFTPDVVGGSAAGWQRQADEFAAQQEAELAYRDRWRPWATLLLGGLGLLALLAGPAALYLLWYRHGRDTAVEMIADYLPEPPDQLSPGLAGALLDETV